MERSKYRIEIHCRNDLTKFLNWITYCELSSLRAITSEISLASGSRRRLQFQRQFGSLPWLAVSSGVQWSGERESLSKPPKLQSHADQLKLHSKGR
ncbi:hypothetical protein M0802_006327 [Mischocyttarus mexicanus]|nr:hypothetical protein M0802_006327 [Mischocyttarus mexicanus]